MTDRQISDDDVLDPANADLIVTNDAVAGETMLAGTGEHNDGPTGGAPGEGSPLYGENDLAGESIDLRDEDEGQA